MNIEISSRDFEITPAIRTYIEEHLNKLSRFDTQIEIAHTVIRRDHHHHKGEVFEVSIVVTVPHGHVYKAERVTGDTYSAFDEAYEVVKALMEKEHDRRADHISKKNLS